MRVCVILCEEVSVMLMWWNTSLACASPSVTVVEFVEASFIVIPLRLLRVSSSKSFVKINAVTFNEMLDKIIILFTRCTALI